MNNAPTAAQMGNRRKRGRRRSPSPSKKRAPPPGIAGGDILSQFVTNWDPVTAQPSREERFRQRTAPLDAPIPSGATGTFYWKFASENGRWRKGGATRPWYVIKQELEERFKLGQAQQQKRGLIYSSYLGIRHEKWSATTKRRRQLFSDDTIHMEAQEVIQPGDRIIVVRLPAKMVARIYRDVTTVGGETLAFEESESEAQRIEKLTRHNHFAPPQQRRGEPDDRGQYPPPHYRCHNCGERGHWRAHCKMGRRMAPKGIPRRFLETVQMESDQDSAYVLEDGTTVRPKAPAYDLVKGEQ